MPITKNFPTTAAYDPRWFIWTIVFLVATGISLVSYIVFSDSGSYDSSPIASARRIQASHK